ncbi:ATP-dependent DNA helicase MER3 [Teratosphaeriaceae sp. CCFEE 6253]|nr:ATP-dependent DNA helicase MER3 [Teratosphaeriaceae sp. CCFEE 6253]
MAERIFQQLDALERGARVDTRVMREPFKHSIADFSACGAHDLNGDAYGEVEAEDQPMALDSFDERLLRQPDYTSRNGQATLGHPRLSLEPDTTVMRAPTRMPDLSHFSLDPSYATQSSSPMFENPTTSSPGFRASQRYPAPGPTDKEVHRSSYRPCHDQFEVPPAHQVSHASRLQEETEVSGSASVHRPKPTSHPRHAAVQSLPRPKPVNNDPPVVQGISLVSTHELPDRFRSLFPFPLFNAVQSKTFDTAYKSNNNLVVSAPTGSGKTAVLELAICRLMSSFPSGSFKIVYQAPTKSLCSERQRDWQEKFGPLDLQVAELTGDTENAQLSNAQKATIIVTTPEKWDSMTRKWKDHQRLMQMVKLFLIDEVHILKENRGATLEAIVSRMKSIGSNVRFLALSATVPNSQDIATWLGKDSANQDVPAVRECFGEEFRPVRLQKHVAGYQTNANEFAFDKTLNGKLPEVISKWSQGKPIMVFCFTRSSCVETAKLLASWWMTKGPEDRYWSAPRTRVAVGEKDLRETISSGVAFHHAGLQQEDRLAVEKGYLAGDINVICCTSTLAVGVNLPCHMVIIKNTVTYQSSQSGGCKEYSDLEIMQMLGRAGRPQFDDSAVAVIMTRLLRVQHYEKMITGQEILESCLHLNLIDHLNAEIGLGTITNAVSAKQWLSGTFLYVRLKENPDHYKLEGDAPGSNLDACLENICRKGIAALEQTDLVKSSPRLHCTEFGDAMARYYLQFDTMKVLLAMPPKAKVSEVLSAVAQAAEFRDVRFRAGEKSTYKDLNKNTSIKFPIPVNIDQPAHKVSLVIQSVLGAIELPTDDYKQKVEYGAARASIFQHAIRLIRCIVDCQLHLDDAVSTRNALMLARSIGAQVWDDSPLHMKQLESLGLVGVRKLAVAGIKSIEDIENAEAHRLEQILSRHPPYGSHLQENARAFPKLRISIKTMGEPLIKKGEHVTIKVKAELGFLNEKIPDLFQRRPVYVCMLAETSDGHKVHFARISAKKLNRGQELMFSAKLTSAGQTVRAYVMCDEIAGSSRHAILKTDLPASAFPPPKAAEVANKQRAQTANAPNTAKRRTSANPWKSDADDASDAFGDAGLDDADLAMAESGGFVDIDDLENTGRAPGPKTKRQKTTYDAPQDDDREARQLAKGKWACNHACKDKTQCKHMCCRDGLDKPPKPPKAKESKKPVVESGSDSRQTQLSLSTTKKAGQMTSTTQDPTPRKQVDSREMKDLTRLHNSVKSSTVKVPLLGKGKDGSSHGQSRLNTFTSRRAQSTASTDYGLDTWGIDDSPMDGDEFGTPLAPPETPPRDHARLEDEDDYMLDAEFGRGAELQHAGPLEEGLDDGEVDFSSYTDEPKSELHNLPKPYSSEKSLPPRHPPKSFLTASTNSVSAEKDHPSPVTQIPAISRAVEQGPSKSFGAAARAAGIMPTSSAQLRHEFEEAVQPIIDNAFLAEFSVHEQQDLGENGASPTSSDALEEWFTKEFGTEMFEFRR